MHHYLAQLISDMHHAATRVPKSKIPEGTFDPDYMLGLEEIYIFLSRHQNRNRK